MTNRYNFQVNIITDDDIAETHAREVLDTMLQRMLDDDEYHEAFILDDTVAARDDATLELPDLLDEISDDAIDKAIDAHERLPDIEKTEDEDG